MTLSRLDLPRIVEAIQELHRIIAHPPTENWQAPTWLVEQYKRTTCGKIPLQPGERPAHSWLIHAAKVEVLNRLMPPWYHQKDNCPEIEDSLLDQRQKVQLLNLREELLSKFAIGQAISGNRGNALQFLDLLESVLGELGAERTDRQLAILETTLAPAADPFAELRKFARAELKGKQRAVIEALCAAGGEMPIADLAVKDGVGWDDPNKGFESAQRYLNPRIKRQRWKLTRQNNAARLKEMPA